MPELPPIRREVLVDAPVEIAFALFTAHIGAWWPVAELSLFGTAGTVAFEGDLVVERRGSESTVWAEVTGWNPPSEFGLAWHPGSASEAATAVRVSFTPAEDGTLVTVEHSGWERHVDPTAAREEYRHAWPIVLDAFLGQWTPQPPSSEGGVAPDDSNEEDQWFALMHLPGPALAEGEDLFGHRDFGEHVAFLQRLDARGLLVAAGPLLGDGGRGMTVLRVPAGRPDVDVVALATSDDQSVVRGLLAVEVRPWAVQFSAR
jgi:uncharacterized protein YciI/uncharacterized protein YndB with AHSA1/START domain